MSARLLFDQSDDPILRPLTRFRSLFSLRDGIFTPLERTRLEHPKAELYFRHTHPTYATLIARVEGLRPASASTEGAESFLRVIDSDAIPIFDALDRIGERIRADLELWKKQKGVKLHKSKSLAGDGVRILGDANRAHVHKNATLLPGVVLDAREGPIVIDDGAEISPFSYLKGPLYIGKDARIDDARIGDSVIGRACRIGGEVENSFFGDFSNKHHEGFVGHSIIGQWVNLGALTTTSDLKNNYGEIRLNVPEDFTPSGAPRLTERRTGRIKFGAIAGDCVKTAIGTMLNTGTVLDAGANLFGGSPGKYAAPLQWGLALDGKRYERDRFLSDCKKIFARRGQTPSEELGALTDLLYSA